MRPRGSWLSSRPTTGLGRCGQADAQAAGPAKAQEALNNTQFEAATVEDTSDPGIQHLRALW